MLIKQATLTMELKAPFPSLIFLVGQSVFQTNHLADAIKKSWYTHCQDDVMLSKVFAQSDNDWSIVVQESCSNSLFSTATMLDVVFEKKTLGADARRLLEQCVQQINGQTLIVVRAFELPLKQVQMWTTHPLIYVIATSTPDKKQCLYWLHERLQTITPRFDKDIPLLIFQYTEGNLLASSQVIDHLSLLFDKTSVLTLKEVKELLSNQCHYSLFDLSDACLQGDSLKAIQLIRQSLIDKTEPTLILWLLTQDIRLLMQLEPVANHQSAFRDMAGKLKIWAKRITLYQKACKKFTGKTLADLLHCCYQLDIQIKTNQQTTLWQSLESLALSLCLGQSVGL